jgi:hypothetical protein
MKKHLLTIMALSGLITTSFGQIPSYVPTNGMIGWWPFDGNANDLSPNGNDGTVFGATPANDRNGTPNAAYAFDGQDDYIQVIPVTPISDQVFSVSMWFYQNETFGETEFICLGDVNGTAWGCTSGNNNFKVNYGRGCGGTGSSPINGAVQLQNWHHVVYISNGVGGQSSIYLDGTLLGQSTNSTGIGACPSTALYFGVDIFSVPEIINGILDDAGMWNRALTEEEVSSLYSGETCTATIATAGPTFFCQGESLQLTANEGDSYLWSNGATTQSITVTEADDYTVVVTTNGCQATSEAETISVNPLPVVTLASINPLCVNNRSIELQGGSPAGGSFTVNGSPDTDFDPAQVGVGQHTVTYTYTDGNNCTGSASRQVTVNGLPTVSFSGLSSDYLPTDGPVQLSGSPSGGVFNGSGVSGSTFSPATAGVGTHGISYAVVNGNGCIGVSALCTTVDISTGGGIGTDNGGNGVELFPNPSSGSYNLMLEQMVGIVHAKVFDAQGREVWADAFAAQGSRSQHTINLMAQSKGIYTLQLQTSHGTITRKLVKN